MRRQTRRTLAVGFLLWLLMSLGQGGILATQESLYLPFALIGSAIWFGLLGLLAIPVWFVSRSLYGKGRVTAAAAHFLMAFAVLGIWIGVYLTMFRLRFGTLAP